MGLRALPALFVLAGQPHFQLAFCNLPTQCIACIACILLQLVLLCATRAMAQGATIAMTVRDSIELALIDPPRAMLAI
jgi:hypothetical protein